VWRRWDSEKAVTRVSADQLKKTIITTEVDREAQRRYPEAG